jgi:hypothetical protein
VAFRVDSIDKTFVDEHAAEVDAFRITMTREDASTGGLVTHLVRGRKIRLNIPPGLQNGTRIRLKKTDDNSPGKEKIERDIYFFILISEPAPPSPFGYLRSLLRGFENRETVQEQPKENLNPKGSLEGGNPKRSPEGRNPKESLETAVAVQLKLKRSQRTAGITGSKVVYMLDARVELTSNERAIVLKHGLGKLVIYDSEARKKQMQTAGERMAGGGLLGTAWGLASVAMAAMSLQITIDSLTNGHHIECKTMDELLGAESAIREGCENLRTYLDLAVTFDGREEIIQF